MIANRQMPSKLIAANAPYGTNKFDARSMEPAAHRGTETIRKSTNPQASTSGARRRSAVIFAADVAGHGVLEGGDRPFEDL